MLAKIKNFLGVGKAEAATLVREIIRGHESQTTLFEPENKQALAAFVNYGHAFSSAYFARFLKVAERPLVKTYLEMGFGLSEKDVQAVLDLKDNELNQIMMDSGSWCPFPFGSCMHHSDHKHHELDVQHEQHEDVSLPGAVVSA